MRLNFATLSSPLQRSGGQGGTRGTANGHAGVSRPTLPPDAWGTVGQDPSPVAKTPDDDGHLSHLSHHEQSEVGRAAHSVHGHVPHVPPVPPFAEADTALDPDRYCWPHTEAMNTAEIEAFTARVLLFTWHGLDDTEAERLADKLVARDRQADDRRMCIECAHLRRAAGFGRCGKWREAERCGPTVPVEAMTLLQRCVGWLPVGDRRDVFKELGR